MENEKTICPECNTENEPKYSYCKNCGAKLPLLQPAAFGNTDQQFSNSSNVGYQSSTPDNGAPNTASNTAPNFSAGAFDSAAQSANPSGETAEPIVNHIPHTDQNPAQNAGYGYTASPQNNPQQAQPQHNPYGGQPYNAGPYSSQPYNGQPYGSGSYNGQSYGSGPNYGQPYNGQQYGNQPYNGQQYNQGGNWQNPGYNPYQPETNPNFNHNAGGFRSETVEGLPYGEVAVFVGKKAPQIMPRFSKMEYTGNRITWCWPAAVLGLIFGPLGSAIWFFYRKMYKIALILVAIGAVLTVTTTALNYNTIKNTFNSAAEVIQKIIDGDLEDYDSGTLFSFSTEPSDGRGYAASALEDAASLAAGILTGLFGYYWYKKHAAKRILSYRMMNVDPRYYQMGLTSVGGTSGGMLALGIIILLGVSYVAAFTTLIIALF